MQIRFCVFLILCNAVIGFCQSDTLIVLPEVAIENKSLVNNPLTNSHTIHTINAEKIQESSARNIAEATAVLPGVYLQDYGGVGGLKTVSSRGLASDYTQVFLDGSQLQNAQTGQIDLGKIPVSNVSKITFVNGLSGEDLLTASSYGLPHSVYLETMPVTKNAITTSMGVGSFGLVNPSLFVQRKINQKQALSVGVDYTYATGEYEYESVNGDVVGRSIRNHAGINRFVANVKYELAVSDSQKVVVSGYWNRVSQELPGAVVFYQPQVGENLFTEDVFVSASYKNIRSQKWQWKLATSTTFQHLRYQDTTYHNEAGFIDNDYFLRSFFTSYSSHYQFNKCLSLNSAIDYRYSDLSSGYNVYRNQVFISNELKYKYKYFKMSGYGVFQKIHDLSTGDQNLFNYGVSSSWNPFANTPVQLHGSYANSSRVPTFQELYYQPVFVDLVPEKSQVVYVGVSTFHHFLKQRLQVSSTVDFFMNRVEDKIVSLPTQNLFVWSTRNLGHVQIRGVESSLQLAYKIDSLWHWSAQVSYTFQEALDVTDSGSREYRNQIAYTPYEIIKASTSLSYRKWKMGWSTMHNGYRYSLGENKQENFLPGWSVHHVFVHKEIAFHRVEMAVQFHINNLFDEQYAVIKSFPMPGRNYLFTLSFVI